LEGQEAKPADVKIAPRRTRPTVKPTSAVEPVSGSPLEKMRALRARRNAKTSDPASSAAAVHQAGKVSSEDKANSTSQSEDLREIARDLAAADELIGNPSGLPKSNVPAKLLLEQGSDFMMKYMEDHPHSTRRIQNELSELPILEVHSVMCNAGAPKLPPRQKPEPVSHSGELREMARELAVSTAAMDELIGGDTGASVDAVDDAAGVTPVGDSAASSKEALVKEIKRLQVELHQAMSATERDDAIIEGLEAELEASLKRLKKPGKAAKADASPAKGVRNADEVQEYLWKSAEEREAAEAAGHRT